MNNKIKLIIMQGQTCLGKSSLCKKLKTALTNCVYLCVDEYKESYWDSYGFDSVEEREELSAKAKTDFLTDLAKYLNSEQPPEYVIVDYPFHNAFWDNLMNTINDNSNVELITLFLYPRNEEDWEKSWKRRSEDYFVRHAGHGAVTYHNSPGTGYTTDFKSIKVKGLPVIGRVMSIEVTFKPNYRLGYPFSKIIDFIKGY